MEKLTFIRVCLSDVSVIMAIMCAPLVYISQVMMGRIPRLKCFLSDARGCMWLLLVMPGI
jgi:hypothetical protein